MIRYRTTLDGLTRRTSTASSSAGSSDRPPAAGRGVRQPATLAELRSANRSPTRQTTARHGRRDAAVKDRREGFDRTSGAGWAANCGELLLHHQLLGETSQGWCRSKYVTSSIRSWSSCIA